MHIGFSHAATQIMRKGCFMVAVFGLKISEDINLCERAEIRVE